MRNRCSSGADTAPLRWLFAAIVLTSAVFVSGAEFAFGQESADPANSASVLARIDLQGPAEMLGIPVHGHFVNASGTEYVLTIAPYALLARQSAQIFILDWDAQSTNYLIARGRRKDARKSLPAGITVLLDDGKRIVVRESPGLGELLSSLGFDLQLLTHDPIIFGPREADTTLRTPETLTADLLVTGMIGQVSEESMRTLVSELSGVTPITVGGGSVTLTTRHTNSGLPIQNATQYAFEYFQTLGIPASYHSWTYYSTTNRNVIGELPGTGHPLEIILVTAHMDDMPSGSFAPGADDNASGAAAVFAAAEILSRYSFDKTIRFALFTGEEQGLLGSMVYANTAYSLGENIRGVLNLDMIAYNTSLSSPVLSLHTRPSNSQDQQIASVFVDAVSSYALNLSPSVIADGDSASDHASFWNKGYAGIMAIEDDNDFNPRYHTTNDRLTYLDLAYFTAFSKAAVATAANLAGVVRPAGTFVLLVTKSAAGSVTSSPEGIACETASTACSSLFGGNTVVSLTAFPNPAGYVFEGWTGSGCTTGKITMDTDKTCSAAFLSCATPLARTGAVGYATLSEAYAHALPEAEIELMGYAVTVGPLDFAEDKQITLMGGFGCGFGQRPASAYTWLTGSVQITSGSVTFDTIAIL